MPTVGTCQTESRPPSHTLWPLQDADGPHSSVLSGFTASVPLEHLLQLAADLKGHLLASAPGMLRRLGDDEGDGGDDGGDRAGKKKKGAAQAKAAGAGEKKAKPATGVHVVLHGGGGGRGFCVLRIATPPWEAGRVLCVGRWSFCLQVLYSR